MKIVNNIFEELDKTKLCYAVLIGTTYFKTSRNYSVKDYCVVGARKNAKRLKEMGFRPRPNYLSHELIVEYDMNEDDIYEFKRRKSENLFIEVQQTTDGRVFEIAGDSLRMHV